jgi:hypothetical protein
VTNDRTSRLSEPAPGLRARWGRFWFGAVETATLHRLRVMGGLLIFAWAIAFAGQHEAFFSLEGWFDKEAYLEVARYREANQRDLAPVPIGWSIFYLAGDNAALFDSLYWGSLAVIALFTLGIATRLTGVLTWVIVVSFLANPATSYDADYLVAILAFYLMIGYLLLGFWNRRLTPLEWLLGPHDAALWSSWLRDERIAPPPSYAANVAWRLFQVHFAIIVVASGLARLQSEHWWAGIAYWFSLHPPMQTTRQAFDQMRPSAGFTLGLLALAQYAALAWQITFPTFAWRRGLWRILLLGGAVVGWLGTFFLLDLPLFGAFYFIGCVSFLYPDEWQRVWSWLRRAEQKPARSAAAGDKIKVGSK